MSGMNWDAVGGISEVAGAIAVVVALLYLAKEIRQNSRSLQISALRDTTAQWNQWSEMLATSPDLADIVVRGNLSPASLSAAEAQRFGAWVQCFFDAVESNWRLVNEIEVEKDLSVIRAIVARRMRAPGFAQWWSENTADYAQDFIDWIESIQGNR